MTFFRTAPGADDDVAMTTCSFGFYGHFSFFFLSTIQNKWNLTHTNFPVQWVKIMRDITQLHELSEQPTYGLQLTTNGQNTFHGTVIVINQRNVDREPVNQPLVIPEKLKSDSWLAFDVKYLPELEVNTLESYQLGTQKQLVSKDYTHSWALASFLATHEDSKSTDDANEQTVEQQGLSEDQDIQSIDTSEIESPDNQGALDKSIISVSVKTDERKRLAKKDIMPIWAATRSLLLSNTHESITRTNTEVIATLFKTSPTDITTLYTVLLLTQGVSAVVVCPERKTILTLDLDLCSRALQIQQTVGNTNWVLPVGVLHIVFAALHALGKTLDGSGIDTCCQKWYFYISSATGNFWGQSIQTRNRIPHHNMLCNPNAAL